MPDLIAIIVIVVGIAMMGYSIFLYEKAWDDRMRASEFSQIYMDLIKTLSKYNTRLKKDDMKAILEDLCKIIIKEDRDV